MPSPLTPVARVRPTLTSADLNRRPNGARLGAAAPTPTGAPIDAGFNVMPAAPRPARPLAPVAPAVATAATRAVPPPNLAGLSGFALENTAANAGLYAPGSVGAANAAVNNTGRPYNPPQQTERANPLSGDNNFPMEGQTTAVARAPFIQRGASIPGGIDAAPVLDEDAGIRSSLQGTLSRMGGAQPNPYARRFGQPQAAQNAYDSYQRRVMG